MVSSQAWPLLPAYFAIIGHVLGSAFSLATSVVLTLAAYDKYDTARKENLTGKIARRKAE